MTPKCFSVRSPVIFSPSCRLVQLWPPSLPRRYLHLMISSCQASPDTVSWIRGHSVLLTVFMRRVFLAGRILVTNTYSNWMRMVFGCAGLVYLKGYCLYVPLHMEVVLILQKVDECLLYKPLVDAELVITTKLFLFGQNALCTSDLPLVVRIRILECVSVRAFE